ncbi:hypothetical protein HMPREF6745_1650 [Prevotella sp. oral taxon 472 str. F0295]|nr:hypothetical protein [Prevotella sp. oral taxon 472]EEX52917.1 hypothetical protein HMPREF6745_1650 [Prevotella sp. oral taxon 472 str. F0295]
MFKPIYCAFVLPLAFALVGCSDNDNAISMEKNGPKPAMELQVTPQDGLLYGDKVNVSGLMTDERNLEQYVMTITNGAGDTLVRKQQSLLGDTFHVNTDLLVALPKNAKTENLKLQVRLDNTRNGELVQTFDLTNVSAPVFTNLYLFLSTGEMYPLTKNGDEFSVADDIFFPANTKGIVAATPDNSGIYWGMKDGEITTMAKDSIVIGADVDASFKVSFNPVTFELTKGEKHFWAPLGDAENYYILGTISGHWKDGEIKEPKAKMAMKGFGYEGAQYFTWTAPEGEDPEVGMWGSTAPGAFRLKQPSTGNYILWDGKNIVMSKTDDKNKSFPVTDKGHFTIRAEFEKGVCTMVKISGDGKSLTFANGKVTVNGQEMQSTITLNGQKLNIKSGNSYVYEGVLDMKKGQTISAPFSLASFKGSTDLFDGVGNDTWTLKTASDKYYTRIDLFNGEFYACPTSAYPQFIYMDGWSLAPREDATDIVWNAEKVIPLARTDKGTYEGTFYNFGWGGDVAFYVTYPRSGKSLRLPSAAFNTTYANTGNGPGSFNIPKEAGYYKVVIDLKDGIEITAKDEVVRKGSTPFTLEYVAK